jgi:hypothetical protein
METTSERKKRVPSATKAAAIDPFADAVDVTPVENPAARKPAARSVKKPTVAAAEVKPAVKVVKKAPAAGAADPFAEIAAEGSTPKKRVSKAVAAEAKPAKAPAKKVTRKAKAAGSKAELSPVFKALADTSLPALQRQNRARLQMQTPTRLYFYWSVKDNPWAKLKSAFGDDLGSYTLVLKLIDTKHGYEKIEQADAEGNFWFDVEPDGAYKAEIGFYAVNRPYFRILHSNTIETPRRSPSPRAATDADWNVSANKFAEVLDVAGFTRDAFDVAMAGDDPAAAADASHVAFSRMLGRDDLAMPGISAEDIRYAMLALAAGARLEELRWKISETLFAVLAANADKLGARRAMSALTEHFDIDEGYFEEEQLGPAVFGASLVNFPRTLKTRGATPKYSPRYNPVSSHSLR